MLELHEGRNSCTRIRILSIPLDNQYFGQYLSNKINVMKYGIL